MIKKIDPIRIIFGIKLKQFRLEKKWSLQELSERVGISASYLNEIEKGKKYPSTDKIIVLARGLEIKYDELVSSDLQKVLGPMGEVLNNKFFTDIPFDFLEIDPVLLVEMIVNSPVKFSAMVNTFIKVGRSYNFSVENLYFSVLRSYLELHKNYFPELEEIIDSFYPHDEKSEGYLKKYLRQEHQIKTDIFDEEKYPALKGLRTVFVPKSKTLFLNKELNSQQRVFALAREAGFRFQNIKVRPLTSTWIETHSFDEIFNNFKASYFAAGILISKESLRIEFKKILNGTRFNIKKFEAILERFPVSEETLFYRLFSIMPRFYEIDKLFFLKFASDDGSRNPKLIKEIHLVKQHDPQENRTEHYCRRWPGISILDEIEGDERHIKTQVSNFEQNGHQYFEIALAKRQIDGKIESITLGFEINEKSREKVAFLSDSAINHRIVGQTCEKCSLFDCKERVAAPTALMKQRKIDEINKAISQLR